MFAHVPMLFIPSFNEVSSKSIKIKTSVFTKQKGTKNETLIFLKAVSLIFNMLIPVSSLLVGASLKLHVSYDVKLHYHISFNALHVLKSYS